MSLKAKNAFAGDQILMNIIILFLVFNCILFSAAVFLAMKGEYYTFNLVMFLQGRLFLSARIVGFYASLFGNKTKFFFLWEDIEDIQVLPPTLASMGSPIIVMTLRPGRGMDARIGAKTHDEEGRLKFHFHSFVSFNVAQK